MTALYLKHRPQLFSSLIGQEHVIRTIINQIKFNKPAHAYLFCGPRGVGKTTVARLLAKSLNCQNQKEGEFEPCDECTSCREISESRAIDVIEIDAASHTGVDNVRENIIENAQFKPTLSPYKIFIIDEVHMLSTSAFNALLKTLEEPPSHVIFILATTESHKLLETIVSRCQKFDFKKIPYDVLDKHLKYITKEEGRIIDQEVIDRIISKSDGCVRDAISLLDQLMATGETNISIEIASLVLPASGAKEALSFVTALFSQNSSDALKILADLEQEGVRFNYFADDLIKILRAIMILKISPSEKSIIMEINPEAKKEIEKILVITNTKEIVDLIDLVMKRADEISTSPIPQLPLEMVVVEWADESRKSKVESRKSDEQIDGNTIEIKNNKINDEVKSLDKQIIVEAENGLQQVTAGYTLQESKDSVFTIDEVKDKWSQFLGKMETQSPSLVFILKMAEIKGVNGNAIQITVQYPFHADKLKDKNCQIKVEDTLLEILGKKARLEVLIDENKSQSPDPELQDLAMALGGEVV